MKSNSLNTEAIRPPRTTQQEKAAQLLEVVDNRLKDWRPLESFFGEFLVPEERKWLRHREITEQLKTDPENLDLLHQRAIARLQCGLPFHAYSDCERICSSLLRTPEKAKEPFTLQSKIALLELLSILPMKMDPDQVLFEWVHFLRLLIRASPQHKEFSDKMIFIVKDDPSTEEIRMRLISSFDESLLTDTNSLQGKIIMLLHALLQSIDTTIREKQEMINSISQRRLVDPMGKKQSMSATSVSTSLVPMQYRSGPGDGRNPEFVSRTLSSLREEAIQNVDIVPDPDRGGFKMVAKRDIAEGEAYLSEEPIVSLSNKVPAVHECALCMKPLLSRAAGRAAVKDRLLACKGCGERYCCTQCKEKAWQQYHSLLCNSEWNAFLNEINLPNATTSFLYSVCMAIKLILMGVSRGLSPLQWPELQVLHRITDSPTPIDPTNVPTVSVADVDRIIRAYYYFMAKCESLSHHMHLEDLLELMEVMKRNSVGRADLGYSALYCAASFANHHCFPNTHFVGGLPKLTLRAVRDIARCEEITISYVNINEDHKMRKAKLQQFSMVSIVLVCAADWRRDWKNE